MTKHPDSTLWNLFSAVMACLTLVVGCAGPTMELTATNTPTIAAATATPASATATVAPPTETPTPTPIPVTFEIINDAGNPAQDTAYQQLLAARLQITETVAFAAYHVGDVASLVLLAGAPRDKVTGATIQPLTRLLAAENELLTLCCPELLALTAANGAKNILLAGLAGKELAISGLIPYTNSEHYAIIQKDDGSVVLKNYLDKDSPNAPEYLLEIDPDNPERLVTYINNSPIYIPTAWQEPIALDEAGDLFINPFEALKAEYVIGNNAEFAQLPEYIQLPNGWQVFEFEGTITNRNTMDIFSNGSVAFGPNGEVFVANNNIDWSQVTDPGTGYAMSLKTDENQNPIADPFNDNSFTLIATFLGDPDEPALVWHPEGGEDGNGAWVEEEKEYATAAEALLGSTEVDPILGEKNGDNIVLITRKWREEEQINFVPGRIRLQDGIEQGADIDAINKLITPIIIANGGIGAIDIKSGEFVIVQVNSETEFNELQKITILDVGEKNERNIALASNRQNVAVLPLPGNHFGNTQGDVFGVFYDPETNTIFNYLKIHPAVFKNGNGDRKRNAAFIYGSIIGSIDLFTIPPSKIQEILIDGRRLDIGKERLEEGQIIATTIKNLAGGSSDVWQMDIALRNTSN